MSWFKRKRRLKVSAITLAELLHRIFVEESDQNVDPDSYNVPKELYDRFRAKVFLYRSALVLTTLATKSSEHSIFQPTLAEYEHLLILGDSRAWGDVRAAMLDLAVILVPTENPNLTWSHKWFIDIGHNETNPITLMVFSVSWMDQYIAAHDSLSQMIE